VGSKRSRANSRQSGFTLVEVMVAMMIVALALPALLGLVESLSQHTFVARSKTQAYWVAQNRMNEIMIERRLNGTMPPRKETDTVELGREQWSWTVTTEETPIPGMFRIGIQVTRPGQEDSLAWISGFIHDE
jgi:general secretion pathway protein I